MPRSFKQWNSVFKREGFRIGLTLLFALLIGAQTIASAQTSSLSPIDNEPYYPDPEPTPICTTCIPPSDGIPTCSSYDSCPSLQYSSPTKLSGPLVYSFASNQELLAVLGSQAAVDDFRSRARNAASEWSSATGISITEATAGQTTNVTISASSSSNVRDSNGLVTNVTGGRTIEISDDYVNWSADGKDYIFSHEWGHIVGVNDIEPYACTGVVSVMRQLDGTNGRARQQLINGYATDPKLPAQHTPSECDASRAKMALPPPPAPSPSPTPTAPIGGGGGGDTGGGGGTRYYCEPRYEWQYWQVCVSYAGGSDCDHGWDLVQTGYDCAYY